MRDAFRALALTLLVAACSPASPSPSTAAVTPSADASGPRPILVDTDLAGDDLLALMALLRDPAVEVRAIAVDGNGEVHCPSGVINVRSLLGAFGLEGIPVACGRDTPGEHGRLFPDEWRIGADAFYGVQLPPGPKTAPTSGAAALIAETAAASPEPLLVVALGPWSNLADAFSAHPELAGQLAGIHAMAGAIDVPGNIAFGEVTYEHGVEWNVGVDPDAFAAILETNVPITLVPLDATNDVPVPSDFATILEADHAAAGADIAFEMFARSPALTSGTSFWDTLAVMALVDPGLVTWEDATVNVEREGLSAGRIRRAGDGRPIRAAMAAEAEPFMTALLAALRRGEPRPAPFSLSGTFAVTWDGATCRLEASEGLAAGTIRLKVTNGSDVTVNAFLTGVEAPRTWADVVAFAEGADVNDPNFAPPDWIVPIEGSATANAGAEAIVMTAVPAVEVGVICATGEFPAIEVFPGGSVLVGG
jgi:inosine-uridine nucleoside N-ribohydrolase